AGATLAGRVGCGSSPALSRIRVGEGFAPREEDVVGVADDGALRGHLVPPGSERPLHLCGERAGALEADLVRNEPVMDSWAIDRLVEWQAIVDQVGEHLRDRVRDGVAAGAP